MTDPAESNHDQEPPQKEGQILGCIFSAAAAGVIFFGIFLFMRACG
jgi:hypothetical protein